MAILLMKSKNFANAIHKLKFTKTVFKKKFNKNTNIRRKINEAEKVNI
jgi:hypothetical protein